MIWQRPCWLNDRIGLLTDTSDCLNNRHVMKGLKVCPGGVQISSIGGTSNCKRIHQEFGKLTMISHITVNPMYIRPDWNKFTLADSNAINITPSAELVMCFTVSNELQMIL